MLFLYIHWQDILTGNREIYRTKFEPEWFHKDEISVNGLDLPYIWTDGNFACDCNRRILFLGEEIDNVECNRTANRYRITDYQFKTE